MLAGFHIPPNSFDGQVCLFSRVNQSVFMQYHIGKACTLRDIESMGYGPDCSHAL